VGWKDGEVTGWMVRGCEWLSAKPAVKTEQKPSRTRNSRKWNKSRNSPNNEKQTKMHKTRNFQRSRQKKENQKNQIREQNRSSKTQVKRHITRWLFKNGQSNARGGQQEAEQNNSWLCGMGGIWCHAMLCMQVVDSRRCPVHGEHENSGAEPSAKDKKKWSTRTRREWMWTNLV